MTIKSKLIIGFLVASTIVLIGMCKTGLIKQQGVVIIPFALGVLYALIVVIRRGLKPNYDDENSEANPYKNKAEIKRMNTNRFYESELYNRRRLN